MSQEFVCTRCLLRSAGEHGCQDLACACCFGEPVSWPVVPADVTFTDLGRTEYALYADGTQTVEVWERGQDGEMELRDAEFIPGGEPLI